MLSNLLIFFLILGLVLAFVSIKFKSLRIFSLITSLLCVAVCFAHFFVEVEANKKYIEILESSNVNAKLEYFNTCKLDDNLKNQIIYSIADKLETLSMTSFKAVFVEIKNQQIVDLLYTRLKERGILFNQEQKQCLLDSAISDKNICFRKYLMNSLWLVEMLYVEIIDLLEKPDSLDVCERINTCVEAFPELFSKNDLRLSNTILDAMKQLKQNEDLGLVREIARLQSLKDELSTKLMAVPINWNLRGTVAKKIESLEKAYLLSDVNIEGIKLKSCVFFTENQIEIGTKVKTTVKDVGEQYLETEKGYITLRGVKEDSSFQKRDSFIAEIDNYDAEIQKITKEKYDREDSIMAYRELFKISVEGLKHNLEQKKRKYEI